MYNCLSIHEIVQLSNACHTHSDTSCKTQVQRKCSAVQREEERERQKERGKKKTTQKLLKLKNYAVYKALIGYNRQPHFSSLCLCVRKY